MKGEILPSLPAPVLFASGQKERAHRWPLFRRVEEIDEETFPSEFREKKVRERKTKRVTGARNDHSTGGKHVNKPHA